MVILEVIDSKGYMVGFGALSLNIFSYKVCQTPLNDQLSPFQERKRVVVAKIY